MSADPPPKISIEEQCELGQHQLMAMDYLAAGETLADASKRAQRDGNFTLMSRILLPLQEACRQRRQRAGEGTVCFDFCAYAETNPAEIVREIPCGQLLVAGEGSIDPAWEVRKLARKQRLYLDTFLGAFYPTLDGLFLVAIPLPYSILPPSAVQSRDQLLYTLPPHTLVFHSDELPSGRQRGTAETFSLVMNIWERLHAPFLAAADTETDPLKKIDAYRMTLEIDYACELAHQRLAEAAHLLARK